MMTAQRGLSHLDARRSEHALLTWDHSGIEQEETDVLGAIGQARGARAESWSARSDPVPTA